MPCVLCLYFPVTYCFGKVIAFSWHTLAGWTLLNVAVLGAVVIYIYAMICFAFVHESFLTSYKPAPLVCDTITQCFVSIIRDGLENSLGRVGKVDTRAMHPTAVTYVKHSVLGLMVCLVCSKGAT